jgi:hypothetical protein
MRQGLMRKARQRILQCFNGRQIEARDHRAIIVTLSVRR